MTAVAQREPVTADVADLEFARVRACLIAVRNATEVAAEIAVEIAAASKWLALKVDCETGWAECELAAE